MEPFIIEKNEEFGRFGIANRDLAPGELFFEEIPFACGPKARTTCCCLECYSPLDATLSGSRCENCSWPLCEECKKLSELFAHKRECDLFKAENCKFFNLSDPSDVCIQLDCIVPLRILLEKDSNSKRWDEDVEPMEHHRDTRFGTPSWNADQQNIVLYLLGPCNLKNQGVDGELIQRIIGVLEVNAFEAKNKNGYSMRCLFPKIAILTHSCTPNTTHSIHPTNGFG